MPTYEDYLRMGVGDAVAGALAQQASENEPTVSGEEIAALIAEPIKDTEAEERLAALEDLHPVTVTPVEEHVAVDLTPENEDEADEAKRLSEVTEVEADEAEAPPAEEVTAEQPTEEGISSAEVVLQEHASEVTIPVATEKINALDSAEEINLYIEGDTRVGIQKAAEARIAALAS